MSKERDLLVSCLDEFQYHEVPCSDLIRAIRWLLAEPEEEPKFNFDLERMKTAIESPISDVTVDDLAKQVKQEPVAWIATGIGGGTAVGWHEKDIVNLPKGTKLYLHPPKRELLGDGITADMYHANKKATHPDSYWAGVYDAEKAHGIGGGE